MIHEIKMLFFRKDPLWHYQKCESTLQASSIHFEHETTLLSTYIDIWTFIISLGKGSFMYYVITKGEGGGQKMAIFDYVEYWK